MMMEVLSVGEEDATAAAVAAVLLLEDGPFESSASSPGRRGSSSLLLPLMAEGYNAAMQARVRVGQIKVPCVS